MTVTAVPTGTVTLVFTDLQASTVLWDRAPQIMKRAVLQHDHVLRSGIQRFRGYEVKPVGDGFMVAFHRPLDAVQWCLETQMALHETDWPSEFESMEASEDFYEGTEKEGFRGLRVRMGVHQGQLECGDNERGDTDYFGTDVSRAARLCDLGHGGQILLSASVWAAVHEEGLGQALTLGEYILPGFEQPDQITQILPESLKGRQFPPLRGVEEAMPEWPSLSKDPATPSTGPAAARGPEAPLMTPDTTERLAVFCSEQFPLDGIRRLALKHDLQFIRLDALDSVQAGDVLVVDGSADGDARLQGLRQCSPVWRHCFWVSFHEPQPPVPGVERLSPLDVARALEDALFPTTPPVPVALEDPPWLEEHRPDRPGFRFNKSAVAVALIWAAIPAFYFMTAEPPLDVELPTASGDEGPGGGFSVKAVVPGAQPPAAKGRSGTEGGAGQRANPREEGGLLRPRSQGVAGAQANAKAAKGAPVTLFKTAYCPACRGVTCLLDRHLIPYKTLDIDQDQGAQAAFPKSLAESDGSVTVPVLQVGQYLIQGYQHGEILKTLDRAGYVLRNLKTAHRQLNQGAACKTFKKTELENWTRPRFSVLSPTVTSDEKRRSKQPAPFDVGPMSACLKRLGKQGKKRLARAKTLSVTVRMGIMGDGRIAAVSVKRLAFGSRRYKRRQVSSCIEGVVVGQSFPLRPKREPEFLTRTYQIP